jgi:hypothetical protein
MKGFLSDTARDLIAIAGLLLAILQVIMALIHGDGRITLLPFSGRAFARREVKQREYASGLKSWIIQTWSLSEDESRYAIKSFLVLMLFVLLGAYVATPVDPFSEADIGWVQTIALIVCGLSLTLQFFLFAYFLTVAEEKLFTEEEMYGDDPSPKLILSFSAFSLILLFLALVGLSYIRPKAGWIQLIFYLYSVAGMLAASFYLVVSTIMGLVSLIKSYLKR